VITTTPSAAACAVEPRLETMSQAWKARKVVEELCVLYCHGARQNRPPLGASKPASVSGLGVPHLRPISKSYRPILEP
jgi:hypothetical protein